MKREDRFRIAVRRFAPFEAAIREQWSSFPGRAGLALEVVALELQELEQALFSTGGMRGGEWDVAFVNTDWIAAMHAMGAAVNLAPLLAAAPPAGYPEAWPESLLRLQRTGGAVLGVPYHDGPECLVYRRDLFEDAALREDYRARFGRELAPPATWEEFHRVARFMTREDRYGAVFAALPDGHNTVYDFLLQLWTRGGELFDAEGAVRFHTDEAAAALSYYRAIVKDAEAVPPGCAGLDSVAAGAMFAQGTVAMMVNWFGFAAHAHTAPGSAVRGMVEVAPVPAGAGGRSVSLNVYWLLALAAGSPHRDTAWQFLRHTQSAEMDLLVSSSGAVGCRRSTWADPGLNAAMPFYHRLEALHEHAREIPQREDWGRVAGILDRLMSGAVSTQKPVAELLAEADRAWREQAEPGPGTILNDDGVLFAEG